VFPLVNNNTLLGSILAGPFLMDSPESLLLVELAQKYAIPKDTMSQMQEEAYQIPVFEPEQITHISRTLYYMCSGLITDGRKQFSMNQRKYNQQAKINESIQFYKTSSSETSGAYPYEKEKALTTKLKTKDTESAKALLNDLLGYVFFAEGNNLEVIKTRSLEIVSLLSRAAIEGGATSDSVLKANNQVIRELQTVTDLDELCYKLQESIEVFTHCMFDYIPTKSGELTKKAIRYISKNYASNITLNDVAEQVHLNPAYFSSLFKQSTGSSFKEYLNMVRIEESKRLLSNTDYSIMDISQAVGFEDQSYFTKIFKKYTGLTPREYR
jgi:YesN/AraC family two-component response regulator